MAIAEASQLSRYRPAVVALVSLTAICGIYYALRTDYTAEPEKGTLRRSNAVHRRGRTRPEMEVSAPTVEAPLGSLVIRSGDHVHVHITNLATHGIPSRDAVTSDIGEIRDDVYRSALQLALYTILLNCTRMQTAEMRHRLVDTAFDGLPEVIGRRDPNEVDRIRGIVASYFRDLEPGIIDQASQALESFLGDTILRGEDYASSDSTSSAEPFAETEDFEAVNGTAREPSQGIKGLLYHIAEHDARRKAYEHRGITCEACGESPIRGVRYHCLQCADYDLCDNCEPHTHHIKTHVFAKIKIPLPVLSQPTKRLPLWYPGDPRKHHSLLDPSVRKRLAQQYSFEEPSIDAYYDQFTCCANVPWSADPTKVAAAIDKRAFTKALTPERWPTRFAPSALFDRMFAFYDTDNNGLVAFEEFVSGMSYLRGPKRFASLRRALQGFDIDGDGFVDRADFMRLLGAKYEVNQRLIHDMVEGQEADQTMDAMGVLRSSQPISSVFNEEEIPQGEARLREGKIPDGGDMRPLPGTKTILDDRDPWQLVGISYRGSSPERLRRFTARFEEMLHAGGASDAGWERETSNLVDVAQAPNIVIPASASSLASIYEDSVRDAVLGIVEQGLHEMLNRIFGRKEKQHLEIINTRSERQQWKSQIEKARAERQAFQQELHKAALVDPLMATAKESLGTVELERKSTETVELAFRGEIVPTDAESLARREEQISQKPLEQLLEDTGYGTVNDHDYQPSLNSTSTAVESAGAATRSYAQLLDQDRQVADVDPTLPQHRPNGPSSSKSRLYEPTANGLQEDIQLPTPERLAYLASLDDGERDIHERGGPGRLSLEEVEALVHVDSTKELRGMVTSWLEWASF